ncbi:MAG: cytochrome b/b6 domain-containing protein [Paracoccaceae bacterium]
MANPSGYSRMQIQLHWAVFVLIVLQFLFHDGIDNAFEAGLEAGALRFSVPVILHFGTGGLILLLAFARLAARQGRGVPDHPAGGLQKTIAHLVHYSLYGAMILLPVTGGVAWGQGSEGAGEVHEMLTKILIALIALHVGAALFSHYVQKSGIIRRMLDPDNP